MTVSKEKKTMGPTTMMILRMKKMMMKTRMKKRISKMTTALTTISNSKSRGIKVQRISCKS
jgi:hypothetical protein